MVGKKGFILVLIIAVGITIYFSRSDQTFSLEERPEVGFKAPSFTLEDITGQHTYSVDSVGKPLVINFWASWCGPCREEAPDLTRLYKEYNGEIEIYAVNLTRTDQVAAAQQFVDEYGFTFPVLMDKTGEVGRAYQVVAIPTTFFVDEKGRIIQKIVGFASASDLENNVRRLAK